MENKFLTSSKPTLVPITRACVCGVLLAETADSLDMRMSGASPSSTFQLIGPRNNHGRLLCFAHGSEGSVLEFCHQFGGEV